MGNCSVELTNLLLFFCVCHMNTARSIIPGQRRPAAENCATLNCNYHYFCLLNRIDIKYQYSLRLIYYYFLLPFAFFAYLCFRRGEVRKYRDCVLAIFISRRKTLEEEEDNKLTIVVVSYLFLASTVGSTRLTFSQSWSFKISHTTFLNYIKFTDLSMSRLWNCDGAGPGVGKKIKIGRCSKLLLRI